MINIVHRGLGGKYTTYTKEAVKRISRRRKATLSSEKPIRGGYKVAICHNGKQATKEEIQNLLQNETLTIYIGDSNGLPLDLIESSDAIISVSGLNIGHQLEAAILVDQLEKIICE